MTTNASKAIAMISSLMSAYSFETKANTSELLYFPCALKEILVVYLNVLEPLGPLLI